MNDLEGNKIVACVLVAGLIAMLSGKVADALYHPDLAPEKRGYQVDVSSASLAAPGAQKAAEEVVIDIAALLASAQIDIGKKISKKCVSCHSFDKGGKHGVGPGLWGVVGASKAAKGDYSYSKGLNAVGGSWDNASLFAFLKKPRKFAPGTKMSFAGFRKPEDIANLVAYLRTLR